MKKIPFKNYIILGVITIVVLILVIYLRNLYLDKKDYENSNNSTMGFLQELKTDELDNFITENRDFILYVSEAGNVEIFNYEEKLKNILIDEDYIKNIVYLNSNIENLENIKKYLYEYVEIETIPNVMIVKDGKIVNVYYPKNDDYDVNKTISFIKMNLDDNE